MSRELIERLRAYAADEALADSYASAMLDAATLLEQQAAEIERLQAELQREHADHKGTIADAALWMGTAEALRKDAERYAWLCEKLGETQLPTLIERITAGYVADYKPSIDAAIDAAMKEQP